MKLNEHSASLFRSRVNFMTSSLSCKGEEISILTAQKAFTFKNATRIMALRPTKSSPCLSVLTVRPALNSSLNLFLTRHLPTVLFKWDLNSSGSFTLFQSRRVQKNLLRQTLHAVFDFLKKQKASPRQRFLEAQTLILIPCHSNNYCTALLASKLLRISKGVKDLYHPE